MNTRNRLAAMAAGLLIGSASGLAQLAPGSFPTLSNPDASAAPPAQQEMVHLAMGRQVFVPNGGQWADASVFYGLKTHGWAVAFKAGAIELTLRRAKPATLGPLAVDDAKGPGEEDTPPDLDQTWVTVTFPGSNVDVTPVGIEPTETKVNYFVGGPGRKSAEGLATFAGVEYSNLYDGIDLYVKANDLDGSLKYEFHVAPGADPSKIRMAYEGLARPLHVDDNGDLEIETNLGMLVDHAPIAWQGDASTRKIVAAYYTLIDDGACRFTLGDGYDASLPLVIDPDVEWMTYLGGSRGDVCYGIAVSEVGDLVAVGYAGSFNFEGHRNHPHGLDDGFACKVSADGTLLWMTYVGGPGGDNCHAVALDRSGNAVIVGESFAEEFGAWNSAVLVCRLTRSGSLVQSALFGGIATNRGCAVSVANSGDVIVSGRAGLGPHGEGDAFVTKLDANLNVRWKTYLGGANDDLVISSSSIAIDSQDNVYVTGSTNSVDFEGRTNEYHSTTQPFDAFVCKIGAFGSLEWMTYLGGSRRDDGTGVVVDPAGGVLVCGGTGSSDFEGRQNDSRGSFDAFLCKVSMSGSIEWMKYFGGGGDDSAQGCCNDSDGSVLVCGATGSTDFERQRNEYHGARQDAFVSRVRSDGDVEWTIYCGGMDIDSGWAVAQRPPGHILVGGDTRSFDFEGRANESHDLSFEPRGEGFVLAIRDPLRCYLSTSCPDAGPAQIKWHNATPDGDVALIYARNQSGTTVPEGQPCAGTQLGLGSRQLQLVWRGQSGPDGSRVLNANVGAGVCGAYLQLLDLSTCQTSNVAAIQ